MFAHSSSEDDDDEVEREDDDGDDTDDDADRDGDDFASTPMEVAAAIWNALKIAGRLEAPSSSKTMEGDEVKQQGGKGNQADEMSKGRDERRDSGQPRKQQKSKKKAKRRIREKTAAAATTYAKGDEGAEQFGKEGEQGDEELAKVEPSQAKQVS